MRLPRTYEGCVHHVAISIPPGRVVRTRKRVERIRMNGIPRISEAAKRFRLNGYRDGRAGTAPKRVGSDYTDGYRRGRAYWHRHYAIEINQTITKRGQDDNEQQDA